MIGGTVKITAVLAVCSSLCACRQPVPEPDFSAPVIYRFSDRLECAAVESTEDSATAPAGSHPGPADRSGDGWRQDAGSIVRWRIVAPRRGYLRLLASEKRADSTCVVRLVDGNRTVNLYEGTPPSAATRLSLSAFGGQRVELEFTAEGAGPIQWDTCEIGGHIDPRDVNVYLLTIDSLRADYTGFIGNRDGVTPFMDQLAQRGVCFSRTWSASNESLPSFASILTSRYPQSHGLIKNGRDLGDQQWSLSRLLGKKGFSTAVYANFGILTWGSTTGRDFKKRRAILGTPPTVDMSDTQGNVFAGALNWATVMWRRRQFLWLHSQFLHMDPLPDPYTAPFMKRLAEKYGQEPVRVVDQRMKSAGFKKISQDYTAGRIELSEVELDYWRAQYDTAVRFSDDHVKAFWEGIKRSGLDPFALTVVVSDHGTSFGERHRLLHTGPPYDHLLHVPLLVILPGCTESRGTVIDTLTETIDIAPTILDYLNMPIPRRMQGSSLIPAIKDDTSDSREFCYAMIGRGAGSHYYAIRNDQWAFWSNFSGKSSLERLRPASGTPESLPGQYPEQTELMKKELAKWINRTVDVSIDANDELSDEVRAILTKAGYLENRE